MATQRNLDLPLWLDSGSSVPHESSSRVRVLVTLPVYNEAAILERSVDSVLKSLDFSGINFTLLLAEDGSTDGSQDCIRRIVQKHPSVLAQSAPERRGRGWALNAAWSRLDADVYAFSDTDFAADPECLVQGIRLVQEGADVVTGSRYVPGARVVRPPLRHVVSRAYNQLVRFLFKDQVMDHQCGLKVFSRKAIRTLLPVSHEDSWFWDTEMLVLANDANLRVQEFPVSWVERKVARTEFARLLSDFYLHGTGLIRLAGNRQVRTQKAVGWGSMGALSSGMRSGPTPVVEPAESAKSV